MLDLLLGYQKDSLILFVGVFYVLIQIVDDDYLCEFYVGYFDEIDSDCCMFNVGVEYVCDLENGWCVEQGFCYQKFDWDYNIFMLNVLMVDGNFIDLNQIIQNEDSIMLNVDIWLVGDVIMGVVIYKILVGLDIICNKLDNNMQFFYLQDIDWWNFDCDIDVVGDFWYEKYEDLMIQQIGIYVQDEIVWNNWCLLVGLCYSWVKQIGIVINNFIGIFSVYQKDEVMIGCIGLFYLFVNDLVFYIVYLILFDFEIGMDCNGDMLKLIEGKQWEIGVKYQFVQNILLMVVVYDLKQINVVCSDESFQLFQIGEVYLCGVELEVMVELVEGWDVCVVYIYIDVCQKGDVCEIGLFFDGNCVVNLFYYMVLLWLDRDFGNGFCVGGGVCYVGECYGDDVNNYLLDSYMLLDLGVSYICDNIEVLLNVLNFVDKIYLVSCSVFYCNYGEGWEVQVWLIYKW